MLLKKKLFKRKIGNQKHCHVVHSAIFICKSLTEFIGYTFTCTITQNTHTPKHKHILTNKEHTPNLLNNSKFSQSKITFRAMCEHCSTIQTNKQLTTTLAAFYSSIKITPDT